MTASHTHTHILYTHARIYSLVERKKFRPTKSGRVAVRVNVYQSGKSFDNEMRLFRARVRIIRVRDITRLFTQQQNAAERNIYVRASSRSRNYEIRLIPSPSGCRTVVSNAEPTEKARRGSFVTDLRILVYVSFMQSVCSLFSLFRRTNAMWHRALFRFCSKEWEGQRKKERSRERRARERQLTEIFRRIPGCIRDVLLVKIPTRASYTLWKLERRDEENAYTWRDSTERACHNTWRASTTVWVSWQSRNKVSSRSVGSSNITNVYVRKFRNSRTVGRETRGKDTCDADTRQRLCFSRFLQNVISRPKNSLFLSCVLAYYLIQFSDA